MTRPHKADPRLKPRNRAFITLLGLELFLFPVVFIIILGILIAFTNQYLKDVKRNPKVLHPPYSPFVWTSAVAPIAVSSVALAWIVLLFWPQFTRWMSSKYWWAAVTTFRLCLVAILTAVAVVTAQYLPLPLGSCENQDRWRPDANAPPNTPTIFDILPSGWWWSEKSGRYFYSDNCHRLVGIWILDITAAAIYFVTACCSAYIWARMQTIPRRCWVFNTQSATKWDPIY